MSGGTHRHTSAARALLIVVDQSCARPCVNARKHIRFLNQLYDTLRHNTATPDETKVKVGVEVLPPEPGEVKPSTIHAMKRGTAASAAASVPKSRGSKGAAPCAPGRVVERATQPLVRSMLSDILTCVFDLR